MSTLVVGEGSLITKRSFVVRSQSAKLNYKEF